MKNPTGRAGLFPRWMQRRAASGLGGSGRGRRSIRFTRAGRSSHSSYRIRVHPIAINTLRIQFMSP
jgi:hypothetical protein